MKKLFFLVSFLMVLVMAPMVLADTVSVNRVAGYYSGNGGEFTLFPSFPVPSDYVPGKTSGIVAGRSQLPIVLCGNRLNMSTFPEALTLPS